MSNSEAKTDSKYWDDYWSKFGNLDRIKDVKQYSPLQNLIELISQTNIEKGASILEIGGAPGKYVSFVGQQIGAGKINILDNSKLGIKLSKKFFSDSTVPSEIFEVNLLTDDLNHIGKQDLVYSLGLIEHFENLELLFDRHLSLVKNGGYLIIGMPVYLGINKLFAKMFYPENRKTWYDFIMDFRNWRFLQKRDDFKIIKKVYVGGFNPDAHHRFERNNYSPLKVFYVAYNIIFKKFLNKMSWLREYNSKYISNYAFLIVKKYD